MLSSFQHVHRFRSFPSMHSSANLHFRQFAICWRIAWMHVAARLFIVLNSQFTPRSQSFPSSAHHLGRFSRSSGFGSNGPAGSAQSHPWNTGPIRCLVDLTRVTSISRPSLQKDGRDGQQHPREKKNVDPRRKNTRPSRNPKPRHGQNHLFRSLFVRAFLRSRNGRARRQRRGKKCRRPGRPRRRGPCKDRHSLSLCTRCRLFPGAFANGGRIAGTSPPDAKGES